MKKTSPTIDLILGHRSIRRFSDQPIPAETLELLLQCAQKAPTSKLMQAYSIISITDTHLKQQLRQISGQAYVEENAHLFIFIADLNRHHNLSDSDYSATMADSETLLTATIDATLAAQNLVLAAQSLGLGSCYIGSLRNDTARLIELLHLPRYTFPLFGVVLGHPAEKGSPKPRLPQGEIHHQNQYRSDLQIQNQHLDAYDKTLATYYEKRSSNQRQDNWREQMHQKLSAKPHTDVHITLKTQGFLDQ